MGYADADMGYEALGVRLASLAPGFGVGLAGEEPNREGKRVTVMVWSMIPARVPSNSKSEQMTSRSSDCTSIPGSANAMIN